MWSDWLWAATLLVAALHLRNLPFAYCIQSVYVYLTSTHKSLVEPLHMRRRVWPGEADFNVHMNNSCYPLTADYGRVQWYASKDFAEYRKRTGHKIFNGGVGFVFLREIRLLQEFLLTTRLVAIDGKWFGVECVYTTPDEKTVFARGLAKIVLKDGRKTVPPEEVLRGCGVPQGKIDELRVDQVLLPAHPPRKAD